ncbi:WD40-repeat-containing domain protein [Syncephalastrum racemosum]|uniref:WD40-repeat-containing domain protein n=1 Tax=Syncephalastrum racemosum TaxID=13706 RepID=A0A1X2HHT1_SYNRA|nr:WD40-repeat-containing domain protein [Syncephalastrum racemosum]
MPLRDDTLARDFKMMDTSDSERNPYSDLDYNSERTMHQRRKRAYFRGSILGDLTAAEEYIADDASPHRGRTQKIFQYGRTSPSPERTTPSSPSNRNTRINDTYYDFFGAVDPCQRILSARARPKRDISRTAIKILDAPELQDDFYLNLVDWGRDDCLAVGLGSCVYLWSAQTSRVTKLCDFVNDTISSVGWSNMSNSLAIGTAKGHIHLWDTHEPRHIRTWTGHNARVGALAWNQNSITSGSRDHNIYHRDVRSPDPFYQRLEQHTQEVCGLKWDEGGTRLASGGNDNKLYVWESVSDKVLCKFEEHSAAVKAIGWSPHDRGLLASGGGTADKTIKFWNVNSGKLLASYDTGSQVCNVAWSKKTNELVSTHGYASNSDSSSNQVIVWQAQNGTELHRIATLSGHSSRVLYMSMNQEGSTIVTGAGDETLRFWDVFRDTAKHMRMRPRRPGGLR